MFTLCAEDVIAGREGGAWSPAAWPSFFVWRLHVSSRCLSQGWREEYPAPGNAQAVCP